MHFKLNTPSLQGRAEGEKKPLQVDARMITHRQVLQHDNCGYLALEVILFLTDVYSVLVAMELQKKKKGTLKYPLEALLFISLF